jgi:hypothetical protein
LQAVHQTPGTRSAGICSGPPQQHTPAECCQPPLLLYLSSRLALALVPPLLLLLMVF